VAVRNDLIDVLGFVPIRETCLLLKDFRVSYSDLERYANGEVATPDAPAPSPMLETYLLNNIQQTIIHQSRQTHNILRSYFYCSSTFSLLSEDEAGASFSLPFF
jgi:hypothetical protein